MSDAALESRLQAQAQSARVAAGVLARADGAVKSRALNAAADAIRARAAAILAANAQDLAAAAQLSEALRDRLMLNPSRVEAMAKAVAQIADLPDPVGRELQAWDNPANGLRFRKMAVPLGVVGIIYESRPNVTADAAAIALKAGNAVLLRGGSESARSNAAIASAMHEGLRAAGLPPDALQRIAEGDRAAVAWMLAAHGAIDVLIPRGGRSLTERVQREARVPTLLHLEGNCQMYLDRAADAAKAPALVYNAKLRRTGVCGALETLLIARSQLSRLGPLVLMPLLEAGCELRGDEAVQALDARIRPAQDEDWRTEYLAPILAVRCVTGLEEAIAHINHYGSHHTDAIVTEDEAAAARFCQEVDSAIVLVNASTQFADGGEFGFGGEIGIATGRLHARGPVGVPELTTYKYVVTTTRPEGGLRSV